MARSRETKIELTAYDDLFQTDESREEAKLSKIRDIPISEIDEFPDHPFKVLMDEDMEQLVESIKRNGVMTPATVRLKEDGRYVVLCQEKVQIKCNQFSLFLTKSNLLFLLHSPRCFQDIVPHIHLETNIHNDCEYALYCKMFRCTQKSVYMHVHN